MSNLAKLEAEMNELILADRPEAAIERFYAADATLQENSEPPVVGKPAILARERGFLKNVASAERPVLHASGVGEDTSFSEWSYDMTFKDGTRFVLHEVARRRWKDGLVVSERFYYSR